MLELSELSKLRDEVCVKTGHWEVGGLHPSVAVICCVDGGSGFSSECPEPPTYEMLFEIYDGVNTLEDAEKQRTWALKVAELVVGSVNVLPQLLDKIQKLEIENVSMYAALISERATVKAGLDLLKRLVAEDGDVSKQYFDGVVASLEEVLACRPVGEWIVSADDEMIHVRWSVPDKDGKYVWIRHYPKTAFGAVAAEREAAEFNAQGRVPSDFEGTISDS